MPADKDWLRNSPSAWSVCAHFSPKQTGLTTSSAPSADWDQAGREESCQVMKTQKICQQLRAVDQPLILSTARLFPNLRQEGQEIVSWEAQ
jgi:hypothetical protein